MTFNDSATVQAQTSSLLFPARKALALEAAAFWWRAGWLATTLAAAAASAALGALGAGTAVLSLILGAAPAGLDLLANRWTRLQGWSVPAWAAGAAAAVLISGGALGPLGVWSLAPLAAGALSGRTGKVALGGAASLVILGFGLLASLLGGRPAMDPTLSALLAAVSLITITLGAAVGLVLLMRRVEAHERSLRAEQTQIMRALDDQPALILDLLPDGKIAGAFGRAADGRNLTGRPLHSLAAPDDRQALAQAVDLALRESQSFLTFTPSDDPTGRIDAHLRRGSGLRIAAVLIDGRPYRGREAELETARAEAEAQNAGKSRFLANMSHELRTPLNAIMGFSDIMRSGLFGPMPDRYGEYAELIHESGRHLLELINDVLDMSKIEADRFELSREEFDAREAVNAVLRLMRGQADRAGVHLRGVLPKEPLEVDADRRALKQIALNLVSNALKFTPRDGAVTLSLQAAGGQMELVVADTGMGMSPQDLARVGRPYEQAGDAERRAAGTGLGLSLVRSFAELHQGDMSLESALGEGTTVTVRMPVLLEPVTQTELAPPVAAQDLSASPAE